jgi:monoamine oxidase
MTDNNILDVAVVGGGISGVYVAWKLLTEKKAKSVTVYEADKHIGGRLLSVKPPDISNMFAELGGMRILPKKIQPIVNKLIDDLNKNPDLEKIDLYPFPVNNTEESATNPNPASDNIVFTRGRLLRWTEITKQPNQVPYKLKNEERGKSLSDIILNAIKQIIPGIKEDDPPAVNRRKAQEARYPSKDGRFLYEQGFWDVLTQVISYEAYKLEQDVGGYSTTLSNWNAADAIPWFLADFGSQATYTGFAPGYRQVVVNIALLFTKCNGANIVCGQKLTSFDWNKEEKIFTLKFANGNTVKAKSLVLAMPRRSLELISCGNKYLSDDHTSELIKSVTPQPAFKIFSTYPDPWWQKLNGLELTSGRSVTDLPIRQTYYWTDDKGKAIEKGPAMLMASYDDGNNPDFWSGYRDWKGEKFKLMGLQKNEQENEIKWTDNAPKWSDYEPKQEQMKAEMTRQLAKLHGLSEQDIPTIQPTSICYKNWAEDPFGGGWNFWNIGVKSPEIIKAIIQPHPEKETSPAVPLYICGDAYSNWQGWVEGALETAEMVLEKFKELNHTSI